MSLSGFRLFDGNRAHRFDFPNETLGPRGIAYGAPAYRVDGKVIAGFTASAKHLSYLPHSGKVLATLGDAVADYATSKGALRFPLDEPLPEALVARLVAARRAEALT